MTFSEKETFREGVIDVRDEEACIDDSSFVRDILKVRSSMTRAVGQSLVGKLLRLKV